MDIEAKIVLCICTCQRPKGLRRLLQAVAELHDDSALSVVVIDNDAAGEGIAVCEELGPTYRWPMQWHIEEQRGISYARNAAVAKAMVSKPDFIAMLDDDEEPCPDWLVSLVGTQQRTGADAVFGPVVPRYEVKPPDWAVRGRFFERPRYPEGTVRNSGATNNCLIRSICFESLKAEPFDHSFGMTGGSDSELFTKLRHMGYTFSWSDRAVVNEALPESRLSKAWLRRRYYRGGQTFMRIDRRYKSSWLADLDRVGRTIVRFFYGCALWISGLFDESTRLKGELMIATAIGKLSVYFGVRLFLEYKTIHK